VFGGSTDETLRRAFTPPFADADYGLVAREARELAVGEQQVGPFTVTARRQEGHSTPTLGAALRRPLHLLHRYALRRGERRAGPRLARAAARGVGDRGRAGADRDPLLRPRGGAVAAEAGAERLVLIHLHPLTGHDAMLEEARAEFPACRARARRARDRALVPRLQVRMDARRQPLGVGDALEQ
jgi:hypothetical protein